MWSPAEDGEEHAALGYDEEEDEFGLPSIASMRRKGKRLPNTKGNELGRNPSSSGGAFSSTTTPALAVWGLDNGDVAEERAIPTYPTSRQTEGKILRPQYKEILRDPANSLHLISHPTFPVNATGKEAEAHSARITRINKFKKILQASSISLPDLRNSAWSGLPGEVRAMSWQLLLGYLPTSSERRVATLERKRKEYLEGVRHAFERGGGSTPSPQLNKGAGRGLDEAIWHQIVIDVPRTNRHLELYSYEATQRSLERILYVWAIRHPASGYVQGINDLVTPFWQVFLGQYITDPDVEFGMDPGQLPRAVLDAVEADSFWCLTKLLDGIQDNYIHAQPGIQRQVSALRDLTSRIDEALAKHMENEGVEFIQFSFRWMNCLLMREVSVSNTTRMWDTYLVRSTAPTLLSSSCHSAVLVTDNRNAGRRARLLRLPSLRLRRLPRQMVGQAATYGLPGDDGFSAGPADQGVDREGYRAAPQRGIHLEESVRGQSGSCPTDERWSFWLTVEFMIMLLTIIEVGSRCSQMQRRSRLQECGFPWWPKSLPELSPTTCSLLLRNCPYALTSSGQLHRSLRLW